MTRRSSTRRKARRHHRLPPGTPPGTVEVDPSAPRPVVRVVGYGADGLHEQSVDDPAALPELLKRWPVVWVNVDGLGDAATIRRIGDVFNLHGLALEDVVSVHQRAKVEQYPEYLYIVLRDFDLKDGHLESDQLSLFLGKHFVLTFQERAGDAFDPVRERLRQGKGRIREHGADYLAYALLDAVIDAYFPIVEFYGERLETLEDEVILRPSRTTISVIHEIRRELLALRRACWPLREAIATLQREFSAFISDETRVYLRDCHDHTFQVMDLLESYRELGAGLMETYLSSVGNRTNEVMRVLTIIATIFIPLTFVAGVYGMNFKTEVSPWNMPELTWRYGYPLCLLIMALISGGLLLFFRRKGWLGSAPPLATEPTPQPNPGTEPAPRSSDIR
jgi:magnesium transporter